MDKFGSLIDKLYMTCFKRKKEKNADSVNITGMN
jgi:hypothetical protein